ATGAVEDSSNHESRDGGGRGGGAAVAGGYGGSNHPGRGWGWRRRRLRRRSRFCGQLGWVTGKTQPAPNLGNQRVATPRSSGEIRAWSTKLSEAQQQGLRSTSLLTAAVTAYNVEYFTQALTPGAVQTISAPTSSEKTRKRSRTVAKEIGDRAITQQIEAFNQRATGTEPSSASTPPRAAPRVRHYVAAAKERVNSGAPLRRDEISQISDTLAYAYLRSLDLPTTGNRDAKRQRLMDWFEQNDLSLYKPPKATPSINEVSI
ncbi:unnamed protein product, partial [Pylaiella littoralis]